MSQPDSPPRDIGMGDSNDPIPNNQSQASSAQKKRKVMKERSKIWDHFSKFVDAEGFNRAKCKYCDKVYYSDFVTNGSSAFQKHLKVCTKLPLDGDSKQTQLSLHSVGENDSILKKWHFDQKTCRHKLAAMIIIDELPFRFVEGEGFNDFMQTSQSLFKMPSRFTVARDCYQIFLDEKKKLTTYFKMSGQRVNITTDTWTSIQKINCMCITAHYIDAKDLDLHLKEWGIANQILFKLIEISDPASFVYVGCRQADWCPGLTSYELEALEHWSPFV